MGSEFEMQREYDFIDRLRIYQVVNNLKQSELGERLGVSQSTICRVLSRKYITNELEQLIKNYINEVGY